MLPVREMYLLHNPIDIVHNALGDDMSSSVICLVEEFGERFFGLIAFFFRIDFPFGLDHIPGHLKNRFQELKAGEKTLFVAFPDLLQSLAQRDECRSAASRAGRTGWICIRGCFSGLRTYRLYPKLFPAIQAVFARILPGSLVLSR